MRRLGLTPKRPQKLHTNRASRKDVDKWRYMIKQLISCLKKKKFSIFMQDEAIFMHGIVNGLVRWSKKSHTAYVPYSGDHKKLVVFGAYSCPGKQLFRTDQKFTGKTFIKFLRALYNKFGKVAVIVDKVSQHRSKKVKEFLKSNPKIKLIYLPTASSFLNLIENIWASSKKKILPKYYPTKNELKRAVSNHFRSARYDLDMMEFFKRRAVEAGMNF